MRSPGFSCLKTVQQRLFSRDAAIIRNKRLFEDALHVYDPMKGC